MSNSDPIRDLAQANLSNNGDVTIDRFDNDIFHVTLSNGWSAMLDLGNLRQMLAGVAENDQSTAINEHFDNAVMELMRKGSGADADPLSRIYPILRPQIAHADDASETPIGEAFHETGYYRYYALEQGNSRQFIMAHMLDDFGIDASEISDIAQSNLERMAAKHAHYKPLPFGNGGQSQTVHFGWSRDFDASSLVFLPEWLAEHGKLNQAELAIGIPASHVIYFTSLRQKKAVDRLWDYHITEDYTNMPHPIAKSIFATLMDEWFVMEKTASTN